MATPEGAPTPKVFWTEERMFPEPRQEAPRVQREVKRLPLTIKGVRDTAITPHEREQSRERFPVEDGY